MPVRKIPMGGRGVRGFIPTKKANELLEFESKLERDFYLIFDYDNTVWNLESQPVTIQYELDGKTYSYTPDIYIRRSEGLPDIIGEVKYYRALRKDIKKLRPKFEAARLYCEAELDNTEFVIFTDKCPLIKNRDYIKNIHFLMRYKFFDQSMYEKTLELFSDGMSIKQLLSSYSNDKMVQMDYVKHVWGMVRKGVLEVDLEHKLSPATRIICMNNFDECLDRENDVGLIERGYLA